MITKTGLTYTRIVTLPPMDTRDDEINAELTRLNRLIKKEARKPLILKTNESRELRRVLENDGYHIRNSHANELAEEIVKSTTEVYRENRGKMKVTQEDIPHIIGKKGKTISDVRDTYRIKIHMGQNEISLKGERVNEAIEEIKAILDSMKTYRRCYNSTPSQSDSE